MSILGLNGLNLGSALFFLGNIKINSFSYFPPAIPEINSLSIISVIFVKLTLASFPAWVDLIHDTHHLCTHLRTDGISNVTWFLRGQTSEKNCQCKKSWSSLLILDNRKWTFHLEDGNGKLLVEAVIVTFLGSSSDRKCVKLVETRTVHFAWLLNLGTVLIELTNSTAITHIFKFYHLFTPTRNTTWHCFYPIESKALAKMVGMFY